MEPQKKKRVEDEFIIIDEQDELRKAAKEQASRLEEERLTMSYIQREELKSQGIKTVATWGVSVGVCLFLMWAFLSNMSRSSGGDPMMLFIVLLGGFGLFSFITGLLKWAQVNNDLQQGKMECVEGIIRLDIVGGGGRSGPTYNLVVEDKKFTITKSLFLSLSNHQPYRIFYSPQSQFVLDTEPL